MTRSLLLAVALGGCSVVPTAPPAGVEEAGLWEIRIRRRAWRPRDLDFVLRIEPDGRGVAAVDPVFAGRSIATLDARRFGGDSVEFTLTSRMDGNRYTFSGTRDGDALDGLVTWNDDTTDQIDPFVAHRLQVRRFDGLATPFEVATDPRTVGVEPVLLDRMVLAAEAAYSDSLLVLSDGELVVGRTFGGGDDERAVGALAAEIGGLVGAPAADRRLAPSELAALGQALLDGAWTGTPTVSDATFAALRVGDPASPGPWTLSTDPSSDAPVGYGHQTERGEALWVYPEARLVVVRTSAHRTGDYDAHHAARDRMAWLDLMVDALMIEKLHRAPLVP